MIRFDAVSKRYERGAEALAGVSFELAGGEMAFLTGHSGAGKSTLVSLLPAFYEYTGGKVTIDGQPVAETSLTSLRHHIAVVSQEPFLFNGTIRENIQYGKLDADDAAIEAAARAANCHEFICALDEGYESRVGERGVKLSVGEKQRVSIARALLADAPILILDEATSALDARTERQVCNNLFEAFRGRTVFFITHRLSTVRPADMIVLMEQGAVMEVGTHIELMQRQGWYYALHQSQSQEGLS